MACRLYLNQGWSLVWTKDGLFSIKPQGTYFNDIVFEIQKFWFKEMHLKMWSAKMAAILSVTQSVAKKADLVFA